MKSSVLAVILSALFMIAVISSSLPVSAQELKVRVGDYWEYTMVGDWEDEGLDVNMSTKLKVLGTAREMVGGVATDLFEIGLTGGGTVSAEMDDMQMSGDISCAGTIKRLQSDFSLVSSSVVFTMNLEAMSVSVSMKMGMESEMDPPLNDYVGDEELFVGKVIEDEVTATVGFWMNVLGVNSTDSEVETVSIMMTVAQYPVSIVTPAGTFECYKIEMTSDDLDESTVLYYSEKVGNYVKMENGDVSGVMMGTVVLKSYKYGGSSLISLLLNDYLWLLVLVVAGIVAIVVALAVIRRSGRGGTPQAFPPPQQPVGPPAAPPGAVAPEEQGPKPD